MSISRRQFILGTAAGFILPSYFNKIFTYFENTGEALLEIPRDAEIELIADYDVCCSGFEKTDSQVESPAVSEQQYSLGIYFKPETTQLLQIKSCNRRRIHCFSTSTNDPIAP